MPYCILVSPVDLRSTHISSGHFVRSEKALVIVEETMPSGAGVYIQTVHSSRAVFTRKSIVFPGKVTISAYRFPATGCYRTTTAISLGAPTKWNGETANVSFYAVSGKRNSRNATRNSGVDYLLCCYSTRALKEITLGLVLPQCSSVARPTVVPPFQKCCPLSSVQDRLIDVSLRGTRKFRKLIAFAEKTIIENRDKVSVFRIHTHTHTCFAKESGIFLSINWDKIGNSLIRRRENRSYLK